MTDHFTREPSTRLTAFNWLGIVIGAVSVAVTACSPTELRGTIDKAMEQKVATQIAAGHKDFTINSSLGGSVMSAQFIGGRINAAGGSLTANGTCFSACVLALVITTDSRTTSEADVRAHASYIPGGPDTDHASSILKEHGLNPDLGRGPNLRRIDGSMAAPFDYWGSRSGFHF